MSPIKHSDMVRVLAKSGGDIKAEVTETNYGLLMEACAQLVASAELLDTAKKQAVYNKDLGLRPREHHAMPCLTPDQWHLLHMALGIAGEAGELLGMVSKHVFDDAPFDMDNAVEELGDGEFYIEGFRQGIKVTREATLEHNIRKLGKRYEGFKYTNAAAQNRADKA